VDGRIPYYVKSDFASEYPPDSSDRKKLEVQVKSEYVENLRINCYQETLNGKISISSKIFLEQNLRANIFQKKSYKQKFTSTNFTSKNLQAQILQAKKLHAKFTSKIFG